MKTFKQFLRLFEALSEDDFYVKRGLQSIPRNVYDEIIKKDPTYKQGQVGDLSFQVLQWYKKDPNKNEFMANLDTIFHNLEFYTKNSKNNPRFKSVLQQNNIKGVQDFKNTTDLNNLMNQYYQNKEEGQQSDIKTTLNKIPKNEYEIIYEDNEWLVADIYTHNASVIFGKELCKGGPWCTTSRENRYHFDQYMAVGDLYFFLNKKNKEKTHYYAPSSEEFADYNNQNLFSELHVFKKENPNLNKAFKIIDDEVSKQTSDINYLLEKRFEKFKKNPCFFIPQYDRHCLRMDGRYFTVRLCGQEAE